MFWKYFVLLIIKISKLFFYSIRQYFSFAYYWVYFNTAIHHPVVARQGFLYSTDLDPDEDPRKNWTTDIRPLKLPDPKYRASAKQRWIWRNEDGGASSHIHIREVGRGWRVHIRCLVQIGPGKFWSNLRTFLYCGFACFVIVLKVHCIFYYFSQINLSSPECIHITKDLLELSVRFHSVYWGSNVADSFDLQSVTKNVKLAPSQKCHKIGKSRWKK